jgi:monoamine oxidase
MASADLDIAVVGGGVAGAYTAWRLSRHFGAAKSVGLFEYSDRIGGRLYSRRLPGMPHLVAELGGMRYMPQSQPIITKTIAALRIATQDFPMGGANGKRLLRRRSQAADGVRNRLGGADGPLGLVFERRGKTEIDLHAVAGETGNVAVTDGMQGLPLALVAGFRQVHPQGCFMNHLLQAIDRSRRRWL